MFLAEITGILFTLSLHLLNRKLQLSRTSGSFGPAGADAVGALSLGVAGHQLTEGAAHLEPQDVVGTLAQQVGDDQLAAIAVVTAAGQDRLEELQDGVEDVALSCAVP